MELCPRFDAKSCNECCSTDTSSFFGFLPSFYDMGSFSNVSLELADCGNSLNAILAIGIHFNVPFLGYFKYKNFMEGLLMMSLASI